MKTEADNREENDLGTFRGKFFVFETTHLTLHAEKLLKKSGIGNRLFPKPRSVISECGLIIKILDSDIERAEEIFKQAGLQISEIINIS